VEVEVGRVCWIILETESDEAARYEVGFEVDPEACGPDLVLSVGMAAGAEVECVRCIVI
jgi:hypothetical protein